MSYAKYKPLDWFLLIVLSIIWGFSFFFIKKGLLSFSAWQVGGLRIFLSFLIFLPSMVLTINKMPWKTKKYVLLSGLLGSGIPPFLFAIAETKISSASTGILNSTTSLFVYIFGIIFFGVALNIKKVIGVSIGLMGAIVIVLSGASSKIDFHPMYSLLVLVATICYGINANILKNKVLNQSTSPYLASIWSFAGIGPMAGILLYQLDTKATILQHPPFINISMLCIFLLAALGTAIAMLLFNILTHRTDALFSSLVTYIMPVVSLGLGIYDGELLTFTHLMGMLLILIGIYLATKR